MGMGRGLGRAAFWATEAVGWVLGGCGYLSFFVLHRLGGLGLEYLRVSFLLWLTLSAALFAAYYVGGLERGLPHLGLLLVLAHLRLLAVLVLFYARGLDQLRHSALLSAALYSAAATTLLLAAWLAARWARAEEAEEEEEEDDEETAPLYSKTLLPSYDEAIRLPRPLLFTNYHTCRPPPSCPPSIVTPLPQRVS